MAYVPPNSYIEVMANVNLTPDYKDTYYFASESDKTVFFTSKRVKRFTNQMYTRISDNVVRVECNAEEIRDCDYIRLQNPRSNILKWYYGFITKVEYVNENVTEITYMIDELQTWFTSATFGKCFIERQHCTTAEDIRGANLVPEPLDVGEVIALNHDDRTASGVGESLLVCLGAVTIENPPGSNTDFWSASMFGGFASTVKYLIMSPTSLNNLVNALEMQNGFYKGLGGPDDFWAILGVYVVPSAFINVGASVSLPGNVTANLVGSNGFASGVLTPSNSIPTQQGGNYTPRNNKLLTHPYTFFRMSTPISHQDLKYETFGGQNPQAKIQIYSTCNPVPVLTVVPVNYNGPDEDFNFGLNIDSFPMPVVFSNGVMNSIGATVGNGIKTAVKALAAAGIGAAGGALAYGVGEAGAGTVALAGGIRAGTKELLNDLKNPIISGSSKIESSGGNQSLSAYMSTNIFRIVTYQMGLREQTARLFDDYFSLFGYAQNKVDTPNLHARSKWTYVKTKGCVVRGNIPATAKNLISRVMDSGITWWDSSVDIGDYGNLSNP